MWWVAVPLSSVLITSCVLTGRWEVMLVLATLLGMYWWIGHEDKNADIARRAGTNGNHHGNHGD